MLSFGWRREGDAEKYRDVPATPTMPLERLQVSFRGQVQGVGFRFTTQAVSARFTLTGFVQNMPDGSVRLVAEGERNELARFLADVQSTLADYIREVTVDWQAPHGEFTGFSIRH